MIRRVRGRLLHKGADLVEVMTEGGVAYGVLVPTPLLERLPPVGEEVEFHTALVVRDDGMELYGFGAPRDRELFVRLQTASGVGPRLALALLGTLPSGRLVRAIRAKEHDVLRMVSGVGKKTAERIALELTDKLDDLAEAEEPAVAGSSTAAVQALRALGYGHIESEEAVQRAVLALDGREVGTEEMVRLALRHV